LLDLPVFQSWSRKNARKFLQAVKYEKVLKGWEKVQPCQQNIDKFINTPDGTRLYMVLDGEFEFETSDRESNRERKGLGAHKELDVRKLLFSRKKATIDDRRRMIEFEEKRLR